MICRHNSPGSPVRATFEAVLRRLALVVDIVDTVPFGPEVAQWVAERLAAVLHVRLMVHRKQEAQSADLPVANVQRSSLRT